MNYNNFHQHPTKNNSNIVVTSVLLNNTYVQIYSVQNM